jgi:hypothetical protein
MACILEIENMRLILLEIEKLIAKYDKFCYIRNMKGGFCNGKRKTGSFGK